MIQVLDELKHEVLSHRVFLNCSSSAVRRGEVKGLTKSSLFRMTLAYFSLGSRCEGEVPERIGEAMSSYKTIEYVRLMSQTRTKGEC
jgi:hypothetical protein